MLYYFKLPYDEVNFYLCKIIYHRRIDFKFIGDCVHLRISQLGLILCGAKGENK